MKTQSQKLSQIVLLIALSLLLLHSCTPYAQAQTRQLIYPYGYERFNPQQLTRDALIVTGGAYALYNIMQQRNPASHPIKPTYQQPAPQIWKCFATVVWPETALSARESYIGPIHMHTIYAMAHTQAYKNCKALGASFQNGCRVTCYQ